MGLGSGEGDEIEKSYGLRVAVWPCGRVGVVSVRYERAEVRNQKRDAEEGKIESET